MTAPSDTPLTDALSEEMGLAVSQFVREAVTIKILLSHMRLERALAVAVVWLEFVAPYIHHCKISPGADEILAAIKRELEGLK